jgi:mevalonate kinase
MGGGMSWQVSAPSKTFLVGEYVALQGGPTLILTTAPRFSLHITAYRQHYHPFKAQGITAASPAGQFLRQTADEWHGLGLNFYDPYHGIGGFGASTAQLVMVMAFAKWRKRYQLSTLQIAYDPETMVQNYQKLTWKGEGVAPSGADFIAQWHGNICLFHRQAKQLLQFEWPFPDIQWVLIHTGQKLVTHHHLCHLPSVDTVPLATLAAQANQSLQTANAQEFVAAVQAYGDALQQQQLVTPFSKQLLTQLQQRPEVLAAKGCGAMGADVVLALIIKNQRHDFENWLRQQELNNVFIGQETSEGVKIAAE